SKNQMPAAAIFTVDFMNDLRLSQRLTEPGLQAIAEAASDADFRLVSQDCDVAAVGILTQLRDDVDVHDRRSMNPHEPALIETLVQRAEQLAMQQLAAVSGVKLDVNAVGLYPTDLFNRQQPNAVRSLHENLVERAFLGRNAADRVRLGRTDLAEEPLNL